MKSSIAPKFDLEPDANVLPLGLSEVGTRRLCISIVIPVYNSETTIEPLCQELIALLHPRWLVDLVLVDDNSTDRTWMICQDLHKQHPDQVSCIQLARNFGEHNAVMAGLNHAQGDYCVIMDDDFQNPPGEVHRLIEEAVKGFDVVYTRYEEKQHDTWRNLGSRFHNAMANYALQKPRDLYLSSFKILSRFVVDEVIRYTGPDPYLDAIILRATRNISTVTVAHQSRQNGRSGYTLGKLFSLWSNMFVAFSLYPLRAIGLYGLITALLGIGYFAYSVVRQLHPSLPDPTAVERLNASSWFFRGSILLSLSIVGEYIGRIYKNLNQSPQYIIRRQMMSRQPQPLVRHHN